MKFTVITARNNRLRLRVGKYGFNKEQGLGLSTLLLSFPSVQEVKTNPTNGGILILHDSNLDMTALLRMLRQLNSLPEETPSETQLMQDQELGFRQDLLKLFAFHYGKRWFLPLSVRNLLTYYSSIHFLWQGFKSLGEKRLTVELLDATAISTSLLMSDPSSASSTMFLLNLSGLLLDFSNVRAKNQLVNSLVIQSSKLWLVTEDGKKEEPIPMEQLKEGMVIRLRTGSLIPVDGSIVRGEASINESTLTGEPLPVHKRKDSTVFAGTVIEEGEIDLLVRTLSANSRVAQIVDYIQSGEESKAQIQGKAEKLADNIVPLSFGFFLATWLLTGNITRASSVLMVDYSCAIKLTTPIAVISALKEAAERQVVVKGGKYLEHLSQVDSIVFDKTGTLTEAIPKVSTIVSTHPDYSESRILTIAACMEEHFPHSVASSIVEEARSRDLAHPEFHGKVEYIVAHGIVTNENETRFFIGSRHFIHEDEGIDITPEQEALIAQKIGSDTAIYLAVNDALVGVIGIFDPPRQEAKSVLKQLRATGISEILMMTGDNENTAKHVSTELGLDGYYASLLPDEKAKKIQSLQEQGKTVLMVGDGINDTPGLSCANVSMTLAGSSDLAREVADISIMSQSLEEIVVARKISTALMEKISNQYSWILGFNSMLIGMGMLGVFTANQNALYHNLSTLFFAGTSTLPLLKDNPTEEKNQ